MGSCWENRVSTQGLITRDQGAELDMLAAEYVVGLLDGDEREQAARLIDSSVTMRFLVEDWGYRLSPLAEPIPPLAMPDIWRDLDRQLFAPRRWRNRLFWLVVAGLAVAAVVKLAFWLRVLF